MGRPKKYANDEERRLARNARNRLNYDSAEEKERSHKRREEKIAYCKAYYEKNKDVLLKKMKEYRDRNKDRISKYNDAYRKANRDSLLEKKLAYSKEQTAKRKIDPALKEKRRSSGLNVARKGRGEISPWYAAKVLKMNVSECSKELLEMKRQQMIVSRQIRSLSKLLKENENG